jgi:hypothetical protein
VEKSTGYWAFNRNKQSEVEDVVKMNDFAVGVVHKTLAAIEGNPTDQPPTLEESALPLPQIPLDDPRVLALARAHQQLVPHDGRSPQPGRS